MRNTLLVLYRFAGLSLGLILSLMGITGSILVFDHALDEMLTPVTITADDPTHRAPLADVLAAARDVTSADFEAIRIYIARKPGSPHVVRFRVPPSEPGPVEVSVAPANATVLAVRTWGNYPATWLYNLHFTLLAGDSGKTIVALLGMLLLILCVSGVVILWPKGGRWRKAQSIRRGHGSYSFIFDLHKMAVLCLLPMLVVVAFSGISVLWPQPVASMVSLILPMDEDTAPRSVSAGPPITTDEAVAVGQRRFPDADLIRVHLPTGTHGRFKLFFNTAAEPWSNHGVSSVSVDPHSSEVLDTFDFATAAAGTRFMHWQFPLHNGDALGMVGRWLVFIVGWLPALLFGTFVYAWRRKRSRV